MSALEKFIVLSLLMVGIPIFIILGSVWGGYGLFRLILVFQGWGLLP